MDTILVLGSDIGTIDVVKEAHKMGLYVIVSDLMTTSPTKELADESWLISTNDYETLQIKCKEKNVKGILYGVSEFNAGCAHDLAGILGLPQICTNDVGWKAGRDKAFFKSKCKMFGAPVAEDYFIDDNLFETDLEKIKCPVVIKPVDKSGNRGMSYCFSKDDIIPAFKKARSISDHPCILCERMLQGPEWVVNYVLTNGEARLLYFGRLYNQSGEKPNLYSMIITSATELKRWNSEANDKVISYINKVGYENGIAWFETILDKDGHFYMIDPGYRFSSEASYALYEKVNGFNSVRWFIEDALGIKHKIDELPENLNKAYSNCVAGYHLFSNHEGIIHSIKGLEVFDELENVKLDLPKRTGGKINASSLIGLIKIYGDTINDLVYKLKEINKRFEILDKDGNNMFIRFTDYDIIIKDFNAGISSFHNNIDC